MALMPSKEALIANEGKPIVASSPLLRDSLGNTALDLVNRKLADPTCDVVLIGDLRKVQSFLEAGMAIERAIGKGCTAFGL
jgi:hypothetical protein